MTFNRYPVHVAVDRPFPVIKEKPVAVPVKVSA